MSLSRIKQNEIKLFILERIEMNDPALIQRVLSKYDISDKTVYRYIKELEQVGSIVKSGRHLSLVNTVHKIELSMVEALKSGEDIIFSDRVLPALSDLPENVQNIWEYIITELLNNVLEHSEADSIKIILRKNPVKTTILIQDNGIGIFNKLRKHYKLQHIEDVILELYKGKVTTSAEDHSGEGIFFISRLADSFALISNGKTFSYQYIPDILPEISKIAPNVDKMVSGGNGAFISLSNSSKKEVSEMINTFSDDDGYLCKSSIPLGNIYETAPVSRSQAKRLSACFLNFREVTLDFKGINFVGQGFAHELFTVFPLSHPEITLVPININEDIKLMLTHVQA